MGFSPCSYLEHILFIRSVPGFPTSPLSPVPLMWFSLKRTTCSWPKPQVSTGNLGEPRDLQFRGPFVEMFSLSPSRRQGCDEEKPAPQCGSCCDRRPARPRVTTSDPPYPTESAHRDCYPDS